MTEQSREKRRAATAANGGGDIADGAGAHHESQPAAPKVALEEAGASRDRLQPTREDLLSELRGLSKSAAAAAGGRGAAGCTVEKLLALLASGAGCVVDVVVE